MILLYLFVTISGVGKTCLLIRYANDSFSPTFITTIGIDFKIKNIQLDQKRIKLQVSFSSCIYSLLIVIFVNLHIIAFYPCFDKHFVLLGWVLTSVCIFYLVLISACAFKRKFDPQSTIQIWDTAGQVNFLVFSRIAFCERFIVCILVDSIDCFHEEKYFYNCFSYCASSNHVLYFFVGEIQNHYHIIFPRGARDIIGIRCHR